MNRRSFLSNTAAMIAVGLVPSLPVLANPLVAQINQRVMAKPINKYVLYPYPEELPVGHMDRTVLVKEWEFDKENRLALGKCIFIMMADHGHIFRCNGENLFKHQYPKLWYGAKEVRAFLSRFKHPNGDFHYETGPETFRLPHMERTFDENVEYNKYMSKVFNG